ncbi:MAG: hypothetical protein MZV70_40290 [Desulfobacterales bacterium]|nr:hypothetical protein [Desulfobacterales bacterium]
MAAGSGKSGGASAQTPDLFGRVLHDLGNPRALTLTSALRDAVARRMTPLHAQEKEQFKKLFQQERVENFEDRFKVLEAFLVDRKARDRRRTGRAAWTAAGRDALAGFRPGHAQDAEPSGLCPPEPLRQRRGPLRASPSRGITTTT